MMRGICLGDTERYLSDLFHLHAYIMQLPASCIRTGSASTHRGRLKSMQSAAVVPVILLFSCFTIDLVKGSTQCTNGTTCSINEDTMRFFILGDFGGTPVKPYKTSVQQTVAKTISKIGDGKRTHFQVELGDNFYYGGVEDVNDKRFQEVYQGDAMNKSWYIIAGNYDHFGNISAQVAYSQISNRWVFPSLYYTVNYKFAQQMTVDFIMIDTVVLCGNTKDVSNAEVPQNKTEVPQNRTQEPTKPKHPSMVEEQWDWIEQQLQQSKADYLFVAGHYPIYSIAEHGSTACLIDRLKPLLHKYKVNAYLSGHDHGIQHISTKEDGATVEYLVSGAASRTDHSIQNKDKIPFGSLRFHFPSLSCWKCPFSQFGFTSGAFIYAELSSTAAQFEFFDGEGEKQYSFKTPPRNKLKINE